MYKILKKKKTLAAAQFDRSPKLLVYLLESIPWRGSYLQNENSANLERSSAPVTPGRLRRCERKHFDQRGNYELTPKLRWQQARPLRTAMSSSADILNPQVPGHHSPWDWCRATIVKAPSRMNSLFLYPNQGFLQNQPTGGGFNCSKNAQNWCSGRLQPDFK